MSKANNKDKEIDCDREVELLLRSIAIAIQCSLPLLFFFICSYYRYAGI